MYSINNKLRFSYFLAQAYHETQGFTKFVENLNYSKPERLVEVWPSRFTLDAKNKTKAFAPDYVNSSEKLANLVYANRNGNGNEASGDGHKYRGRGGFHLTFLNNYKAASLSLFKDERLLTNPNLVQDYDAGIKTAGWFWNTNNLNVKADKEDFTGVTRVVNGSEATVKQRLVVLEKITKIL